MNTTQTLGIIKPDPIKDGHIGHIISMIEKSQFSIHQLSLTSLTFDQAAKFYKVHAQRPFYKDLCTYMSSGPIIVIALLKSEAVTDFRKLIGHTNPAQADANTIRNKFGKSIEANAIHGSDSDQNAQIELDFFSLV